MHCNLYLDVPPYIPARRLVFTEIRPVLLSYQSTSLTTPFMSISVDSVTSTVSVVVHPS